QQLCAQRLLALALAPCRPQRSQRIQLLAADPQLPCPSAPNQQPHRSARQEKQQQAETDEHRSLSQRIIIRKARADGDQTKCHYCEHDDCLACKNHPPGNALPRRTCWFERHISRPCYRVTPETPWLIAVYSTALF